MSKLTTLLTVLFFVSCQLKTQQVSSENSINIDDILFLKVKIESDTIKNGGRYVGKMFFTKDSLFQIARSNEIQEYVEYQFLSPIEVENFKPSDDTARFIYNVRLDSFQKSGFRVVDWLAKAKINFNNEKIGVDTVFSVSKRFVVVE